MTDTRRYRQVVRYVTETPWALLPSMLLVIRELVALHLAGEKLEQTEIEARIGRARPRQEQPTGGGIAVIPLWGVLVPHAGMMVDVSTPGTALESWLEDFQAAVDDPNVASILLNVDSPGGSTDLVSETAAAVRAARAQKPVYAVANTMAASAAYAIASQADKLFVSPSGVVGSVGVYAVHEDLSAALEAEGVKPTVISAPEGGFKTELSPFGPLSEEARAHVQSRVNYLYSLFINDVAKGRGIDASTVDQNYGRGRVLGASDALRAGMVDGVASLNQVLTRLLNGQEADGSRGARSLAPAAHVGEFAVEPAAAFGGGRIEVEILGDVSAAAAMTAAAAQFAHGHLHQPTVGPIPAPATAVVDEPSEDHDFHRNAAPSAAATAVSPNASGTTTTGGHMEPVSTDRPPSLEELAAQQDQISARMTELNEQAAGRMFTGEEQDEFDNLVAEHERVEETMTNLRARAATLAKIAKNEPNRQVHGVGNGNGGLQTNAGSRIPENVFDLSAYRAFASSIDEMPRLWRDGALKANERLLYETEKTDAVKAHVERLLAKDSSHLPSESFAHRILVTASPVYEAAFGKWVMGRPLNAQEELAIKAAVSNTGLGAETPVPVTIDPTVILTSDGQTNPLRAIARTVTITGNKWRGIASDGVTVAYQAELTEVADQTPTFDSPEAEVAKAHGYVEFSIEVDEDWGQLRSNLATMFADAKDAKEAEKFLFGTGVNEPEGLIFALEDDGTSIVPTGTLHALAVGDLTTLIGALPPRFRSNAQWLGSLGTFMFLADSVDDNPNFWIPISQGLANRPSGNTGYNLKGYPANDASGMSDAVTTGDADVLVLGDFQKGFVIVDRVGLNVELIPHVFGPNRRPMGKRALYVYFRNTSKLITPNAFRMLQIKNS